MTPLKPYPSLAFLRGTVLCCLALCLLTCGREEYPGLPSTGSEEVNLEDLERLVHTEAMLEHWSALPARTQMDSLLYSADRLKNFNDEAALTYAREANLMAIDRNWKTARAVSHYYLALLNGRREEYGEGIEDALVDARISRRLFAKTDDPVWQIETNNLFGIFFYRKFEYDSAKHYLHKSLDILSAAPLAEKDALRLRGETLHAIADVYSEVDTSLALQFYSESMHIFQSIDNQAAHSRLRMNLGEFYFYQKERFPEAEELIGQSITYALQAKDTSHLADCYQRLAYLRYKQYQKEKEDSLFYEAIHLFRKASRLQKENLYQTYRVIGNAFQERFRQNYTTGDYSSLDSALINYQKAMESAQREGVIPVMRKMVNNISSLCDYKATYLGGNCEEILNAPTTSFINDTYSGIVDTITQNLELAGRRIREFERREQQAASQRRSQTQLLVSGGVLVIAVLVFLLLLQQQQQKRLRAKMEALRAQINPHFISNSLNAIESLVNLDQKEAAAKYLIHFSRLSRRILNSSREEATNLAEELKTLEHFLALEHLRFRDKLQYEITVEEGLNSKMVKVPAMILQPYIENAILHGIKPKEGIGHLRIRAERKDKHLLITIEDDGIGRERSRALKAASVFKHKSMGMQINEERLRVIGRSQGAKAEIIDLHDANGQAAGTRVVLRMPYRHIENGQTS